MEKARTGAGYLCSSGRGMSSTAEAEKASKIKLVWSWSIIESTGLEKTFKITKSNHYARGSAALPLPST